MTWIRWTWWNFSINLFKPTILICNLRCRNSLKSSEIHNFLNVLGKIVNGYRKFKHCYQKWLTGNNHALEYGVMEWKKDLARNWAHLRKLSELTWRLRLKRSTWICWQRWRNISITRSGFLDTKNCTSTQYSLNPLWVSISKHSTVWRSSLSTMKTSLLRNTLVW